MPTATVQTIYCVQPATGTDFGVNQAVINAIMSLTPQFSQNDFSRAPRPRPAPRRAPPAEGKIRRVSDP